MSLKLTTKTFFELEESQLNNLIQEIYGQEYSFALDTNTASGFAIFTVGEEDCDLEKINKFIEGEEVEEITVAILHDLFIRNEIVAGDYLIKVN